MVKLVGPQHSDEAHGKFAGCIVYAKNKGVNYARVLTTPKNLMSEDQGDYRQMFGGAGRAGKAIKATSDYANQLITLKLIPSRLSKQGWFVSFVKSAYLHDATAFEALHTAFDGHSAKADFTSQAALAGLSDLEIAYKGTTNLFSKGMMLYMIAKAAIDNGFTGSPYTVTLSTWALVNIEALVADLVAAV